MGLSSMLCLQWAFGVTCWEVFSLGRTPYPMIPNSEIFSYISSGKRLDRPALCPKEMQVTYKKVARLSDIFHRFDVMSECWEHRPDERPSFKKLVKTVCEYWDENYGYI